MKKFHLILILLTVVLVIYTLMRTTSNHSDNWNKIVPASTESVHFLFEDNNGNPSFTRLDIPHFQFNWGRSLILDIPTGWMDTLKQENPVILTINMWDASWIPGRRKTVLDEINSGDRDADIIGLCETVLSRNPHIWLRWNPEMEVPADRFPWQNMPFSYIRAFRHLDSLVSLYAPTTQMVWGASGYPGAPEFWPGNDAADLISITLQSKSESMVSAYPPAASVGDELRRKLHRLRFLNAPVIIISRNDAFPADADLEYIIEERESHKSLYRIQNENGKENENENENGLQLGVYDPEKRLVNNVNVDVEHFFTDFEHITDSTFYKTMKGAERRGHDLIVTFEPMYPSKSERDRSVLDKILAGYYDSLFYQFTGQLNSFKGTIYLRFAHEMEIPIERYPWQSQDPVKYIDAFRYFMSIVHSELPDAKRVWGPAGDRGSLEWYPGDAYVDMISVAIYGLPDKNITDPEKQESFETIYNRKYRRMRFVHKPVFITEFGVKGPEEYQHRWLQDAATVIRDHEEIIGINYFNMVDNPDVWGEGMKAPDWSLTEHTWDEFTKSILR